jgi:hypothetical protein
MNAMKPRWPRGEPHDPFQTMLAEVEYGMSILRPHYPKATDDWLKARFLAMRPDVYQDGWPTDKQLAAIRAAGDEAEAANTQEENV